MEEVKEVSWDTGLRKIEDKKYVRESKYVRERLKKVIMGEVWEIGKGRFGGN